MAPVVALLRSLEKLENRVAWNTRSDPLTWLEDAARDGRGVRWLSPRNLCVYDAETARALLRNDGQRMTDHSDFFGNGADAPARDVQISLARQVHARLQQHLQMLDCRRFVSVLPRRSEWPRAGNALLLDIMRPVLAGPRRSTVFHEALERMVRSRIFSRHDRPASFVRRIGDRFRFYRAVVGEPTSSERAASDDCDIFEILRSYGREIDETALVQLYAGFVFAVVGSIGFALGWSVLQAVREQKTDHRAANIVLESLRLYPVAWLFHRWVRQPDSILGERVLPEHTISISPYAIHRNPRYWKEPTVFSPDRWSKAADRTAWVPFGAGEHACVAAGLSVNLASRLLSEILLRDPKIESVGDRPSIGAALAPPAFVLELRSPT